MYLHLNQIYLNKFFQARVRISNVQMMIMIVTCYWFSILYCDGFDCKSICNISKGYQHEDTLVHWLEITSPSSMPTTKTEDITIDHVRRPQGHKDKRRKAVKIEERRIKIKTQIGVFKMTVIILKLKFKITDP